MFVVLAYLCLILCLYIGIITKTNTNIIHEIITGINNITSDIYKNRLLEAHKIIKLIVYNVNILLKV